MANISIPNLPSQTATTELDLLVIVNSGETTTSKITKADFLNGVGGKLVDGTGVNSFATLGNEARAPGQATIFMSALGGANGKASGYGSIVISTVGEAEATGAYSMNLSKDGAAGGNSSTIIGGYGNSNYNTLGTIVGALEGTISSPGSGNVIFGGAGNTISNGYNCVILGGASNRHYGGSNLQSILCSNSSRTSATNNASQPFIAGSSEVSVALDNGLSGIFISDTCGINSEGTKNGIGKIDADYCSIFSSYNSYIKGTSSVLHQFAGIYNSSNVLLDGLDNVVVLGMSGYTGNTDNVVVVPGMVYPDYTNMDYADDTAAAAGGVVLGEVYHNSGAVRIRIA